MIQEIERKAANGIAVLLILIVVTALLVYFLISGIRAEDPVLIVGYIIALSFVVFLYFGLFVVNPNEGKVLQLFGKYVGTVRDPGLRWANPFYTKKRVSLRVLPSNKAAWASGRATPANEARGGYTQIRATAANLVRSSR